MKPAPFEYVAPRTIAEACSTLAEAGGGATVLAGGQTLIPLLNLRLSQPFIIVDINKIADLKGPASSTPTGPEDIPRYSAKWRSAPAILPCWASWARS